MNFNKNLIIILTVTLLFGCVAQNKNSAGLLSGKVIITDKNSGSGPVFIAVTNSYDFKKIKDDPMDSILTVISPDKNNTYKIDTAQCGISPGDHIYIFAFIDNDYKSGMPIPTADDYIGIYINESDFEVGYTVTEYGNDKLDIEINRRVYDYSATVSGLVEYEESEQVILTAYSDNMKSLNPKKMDFTKIIGYKKIIKQKGSTAYELDILPFGENVPRDGVIIMAIFDKNKNNRPDAGDKIGYYSITNMNTPSPITIIEGVNENINISAKYEIPSLSGYKMSVTGKFDIDANLLNSPVYTIIAKTSDPNTISENPMSVIKEFYRHSGDAQFNIDLSNTDLLPGDEVMVMTIAEQDLKRGEFPNPTRGDVIGIYQNPKDFKFSFKLKDGVNNINPDSNWTYSVNKTIKNNSVAISGILNDNDANDVLLIAYNKPFTSLNFSEFDINYVIGYKKFSKPTGDFSYTFNLLPYADDLPLNGISIIGLFDINQNGKPDAGDKIGFYSRSGSMPSVISLAGNQSGIDITPRMTIPASSSTPLSIAGNIDALSEYSLSEKPCYIVIAKTKFPSELIDNPISVIKDFKKLEAGQTDFNIDLSQTGLQENDEVMIVALWDKDAITGDFPNVTKGDVIGYFQNSRELQYTVKLKKGVNYIISNNDWRFNLNKEVYDYFAEVSGNITDPENGNVVMIAYAGEISSLDFTSINIDNVIGYSTINKTSETQPYRIKIIPCGKNIPISGVTIIAMLDSNNNGKPDENEKIGYYSLNNDNMPTSVTINSGTLNNINVNLSLSIPEPSGYNITLSGNFALPAGYTPDKPIYILAAHTSDPEILFNNPTSVIKEFQKLPPNTNSFNISLKQTDLIPGDDIMVIALWDKDYSGGTGIPSVSAGDSVGFYQWVKKNGSDVTDFSFTVKLVDGANFITHNSADNGGLWEFEVGKIMYNYNTSVNFKIESSGRPSGLVEGRKMFAIAVYETGVNGFPSYKINDPDYVLAYDDLSYSSDANYTYSFKILQAIDRRITNTASMKIFTYVIYDRDNNGKPSSGDDIAAYWENKFIIGSVPKKWTLTSDIVNTTTIKFLNKTY